MEKFKKCMQLSFVAIVGLLFGMSSISEVNAMTTMPEAVDGVITLTEDVTLSSKFVIQNGETITIDFNGYTVTGPSNDFAIYNLGTATIVDNGSTKGKVYCRTPDGAEISCIRNDSTMTIKGVTVDASYIAIKNHHAASTLTIDNSNISAITETALLNYGTATVNNSNIKTASKKGAIAFDCDKSGTKSITNINNSTLEGTYVLQNGTNDKKTKRDLNINNVELKGSIPQALFLGPRNTNIKVSGDNKANGGKHSLPFLANRAPSGSTVTLTENASATFKIPAGVTVIVPEGITLDVEISITVNGNLDVKGILTNANAYNEITKKYYKSFSSAVSEAKDGEKIILENDVKGNATTKANGNVTLELNGHTLTGNITNVANGSLTIKDSSESKTGKVDGVITNNGNLTLESGNYTNMPTTNTDAKTIINGGTYPTDQKDKAEIPDNTKFVQNDDGTYSLEALADTKELEEILTKLEKLTEKDYETYTEKSLENFLTALEKADDLLSGLSDEPTVRDQQTVDEITKLLTDGYNSLVKKEIIKEENSKETTKNEENPQTLDDTITYVILAAVALAGTISSGLYLRKSNSV